MERPYCPIEVVTVDTLEMGERKPLILSVDYEGPRVEHNPSVEQLVRAGELAFDKNAEALREALNELERRG